VHRTATYRCDDTRCCIIQFPDGVVLIFYCPNGVDSDSKRNKYQKFFPGVKDGRCVGLTTLSLLCADYLDIWEPQHPGILGACPGLNRDCFTFIFRCYKDSSGTAVARWLRFCATNRKVAGSIPDGVIGIFH